MRIEFVLTLMGVCELILRLALGGAGFWCIWNDDFDQRVGIQFVGVLSIVGSIYGSIGLRTISVAYQIPTDGNHATKSFDGGDIDNRTVP